MDIIGFLYVCLGSSTVQLHYILGSRRACACSEAGFSSQNGDRAWGVYYQRAAFCCAFFYFLWAKGLHAKDVHKEMLPIYGGKCLSCKAVHNWVERFSQGRLKVTDDARPGCPFEIMAETTVKRILCCGFWHTGKAMGQVYQCWWRICREINVLFQVWISHVLCYISICDLFTDSPLYFFCLSFNQYRIHLINSLLLKCTIFILFIEGLTSSSQTDMFPCT
jgi:hypothetical protein